MECHQLILFKSFWAEKTHLNQTAAENNRKCNHMCEESYDENVYAVKFNVP